MNEDADSENGNDEGSEDASENGDDDDAAHGDDATASSDDDDADAAQAADPSPVHAEVARRLDTANSDSADAVHSANWSCPSLFEPNPSNGEGSCRPAAELFFLLFGVVGIAGAFTVVGVYYALNIGTRLERVSEAASEEAGRFVRSQNSYPVPVDYPDRGTV